MEKIAVEINDNSEVLINGIIIDDAIFMEEKSDYTLVERLGQIDNLIGWISECGYGKENDKLLMKDDLKYLMNLEDKYIFSNIGTNEYIAQSDSLPEFFGICRELLRLNGWSIEKADSFLRKETHIENELL